MRAIGEQQSNQHIVAEEEGGWGEAGKVTTASTAAGCHSGVNSDKKRGENDLVILVGEDVLGNSPRFELCWCFQHWFVFVRRAFTYG